MPKENQRVAISKKLLKDGILRLLKKKHISNISISELCEEAQINRTTFYRHYQTPHDVLIEIELDFISKFYETSQSPQDSADIKKQVIRLCNFLYDNQETIKLFIVNNTDQDFIDVFQNFATGFLGSREIRYKGHAVDEDTLRLVGTFFAFGGYALIRQWLMEGVSKSPDEIADLILGSFNRNITFM